MCVRKKLSGLVPAIENGVDSRLMICQFGGGIDRYTSNSHSETFRQSYSSRRRLRSHRNTTTPNNRMAAKAPMQDPTMIPPFKLELDEPELKAIIAVDDVPNELPGEEGVTVTVYTVPFMAIVDSILGMETLVMVEMTEGLLLLESGLDVIAVVITGVAAGVTIVVTMGAGSVLPATTRK